MSYLTLIVLIILREELREGLFIHQQNRTIEY